MQALTFKRGVHPPDGKELAKDQPIKVIMPKENSELFYPMSQHIGAPCDPLVAVGDHVKVGQKIAESGAFMSSPIFASVSGEVVDIRPMLVPGGAMVKAIVVKNDGKMEEIEGLNEGKDYTTMTNDEILAAIKNAGVVGLGGAGFPTHVKLNPPKDTPIDHILINAAECELPPDAGRTRKNRKRFTDYAEAASQCKGRNRYRNEQARSNRFHAEGMRGH